MPAGPPRTSTPLQRRLHLLDLELAAVAQRHLELHAVRSASLSRSISTWHDSRTFCTCPRTPSRATPRRRTRRRTARAARVQPLRLERARARAACAARRARVARERERRLRASPGARALDHRGGGARRQFVLDRRLCGWRGRRRCGHGRHGAVAHSQRRAPRRRYRRRCCTQFDGASRRAVECWLRRGELERSCGGARGRAARIALAAAEGHRAKIDADARRGD